VGCVEQRENKSRSNVHVLFFYNENTSTRENVLVLFYYGYDPEWTPKKEKSLKII
jgi:hypothetical protein